MESSKQGEIMDITDELVYNSVFLIAGDPEATEKYANNKDRHTEKQDDLDIATIITEEGCPPVPTEMLSSPIIFLEARKLNPGRYKFFFTPEKLANNVKLKKEMSPESTAGPGEDTAMTSQNGSQNIEQELEIDNDVDVLPTFLEQVISTIDYDLE